jgi:hypothetical protein
MAINAININAINNVSMVLVGGWFKLGTGYDSAQGSGRECGGRRNGIWRNA